MNSKHYYYKGIILNLMVLYQYLDFSYRNFMTLKILKIIIQRIIRLNSTIFMINFQFINFHHQTNFFNPK